MRSLPTVDQINIDNYLSVVQTLDPELYLIRLALNQTGVNPMIIPQVIRSIANLYYGTGYGRVQIFMVNKQITQIKGEESVKIEEKASIEY